MDYNEMKVTINNFIKEYYAKRTADEIKEFGKRVKAFYENNEVPEDLDRMFVNSGIGEMFYMAIGYGLLE